MASRYWEEREQANKRRYNRADKEAQKEVREIHKRMQDEIQKDIDAFFGKYAADEGISLAEAKRRVSKLDIEAFERKAKKYVEDRDFSEQANAEMKLYNLTMKINRLELLKAEIGLEMVKAHDDINGLTDRVLLERAEEEYRRQAGILGDTVQDIAGRARRLADASFHNATWKDRAWTNHAELKANLDVLLQRGLIRGDNPRQLARSLHKALNVDLNKCERLMVTELARVQIDASIDSFVRNGFERYQYITCGYGDACENCKALSDKDFAIKDMQVGENAPPMHPWCHCSIAPYEDGEEYDAWLDFLEQGGTTAEWENGGKEVYFELKKTNRSSDLKGTVSIKVVKEKIKRAIDIITSHEPVSLRKLKNAHKNELLDIIDNAPDNVKTITVRLIDKIMFVHEKAIAIPCFTNKGIFTNMENDLHNRKGKWANIFHEIGHSIDWLLGDVSHKDAIFIRTLENDFETVVNKYMEWYNVDIDEAKKLLARDITSDSDHAVSDIIGGLTKNECAGRYKHDTEYWEKPNMVEREAFAHFYEATIRNDVKALKRIREMFPNAYKCFEEMLRGSI